MTGSRRLSQAISEGDGISLIPPVDEAEDARRVEVDGAEALLVYSGNESRLQAIRDATSLPILFYWDGQRAESISAADACIVEVEGGAGWMEHVHLELGDGFELALRIDKEDQLAAALENFDPEIFVLAAAPEDSLQRVLDLLPDVPAGKLAIADVRLTSREELEELERAGVDAVIVGAQDVARLVSAAPPEV